MLLGGGGNQLHKLSWQRKSSLGFGVRAWGLVVPAVPTWQLVRVPGELKRWPCPQLNEKVWLSRGGAWASAFKSYSDDPGVL